MRTFESGATRNDCSNKLDYEGFINPGVLKLYSLYMHKHRLQADGNLRDSDNWQKGMPQDEYIKSLVRHTFDVWLNKRNLNTREDMVTALCGVLFNTMGWLNEEIKKYPELLNVEWEE